MAIERVLKADILRLDPAGSPDLFIPQRASARISALLREHVTPRQEKVVRLYFGLGCSRSLSATEIAQEFQVSRKVISGIVGGAQTKLAPVGLTPSVIREAARLQSKTWPPSEPATLGRHEIIVLPCDTKTSYSSAFRVALPDSVRGPPGRPCSRFVPPLLQTIDQPRCRAGRARGVRRRTSRGSLCAPNL